MRWNAPVETEGESLVKGLENLVADLEANEGEMLVRLADDSAFELGRNVATAEGSVVYRNHIMELIQYAPTHRSGACNAAGDFSRPGSTSFTSLI